MGKILGLEQVRATKHKVLEFDGAWRAAFGRPARTGTWLIWGSSNSGKTRFALQLCKYLCRFGRVAYDSLEEGNSLSMQRAIEQTAMTEVSGKFVLLDKMTLSELEGYMRNPKGPNFVVIDSFQYARLNYTRYVDLKERFPNRLIILISHAEGVDCKIRVEGFKALVAGRFIEGKSEPYVIWEEGANTYWGDKDKDNNNQYEQED